MPRRQQVGITLPRELWERVRALPLKKMGYASPTELVRDLLRRECESIESTAGRRD